MKRLLYSALFICAGCTYNIKQAQNSSGSGGRSLHQTVAIGDNFSATQDDVPVYYAPRPITYRPPPPPAYRSPPPADYYRPDNQSYSGSGVPDMNAYGQWHFSQDFHNARNVEAQTNLQ